MKAISPYRIHLPTLTEREETFEYKLNKSFFEQYSDDSVEDIACVAKVRCEKEERMLTCTFRIEGTITLICDRSLKPFNHEIGLTSTIYFKFGEHYEEQAENLIIIPNDTVDLDISQPIFDILYLAIPSRRLHPDHRDELSDENYFFTTKEKQQKGSEMQDQENIDPRWAALQKLKKQ